MKRHGNLILNEGDFGTFYTEQDGTKFYLRVRSFIDIKTGELLTDDAGQPERRQQKALLATKSDKYTSEKSPEVVALAGQLRRRIIANEEAAVNGQVGQVASDGNAPAPRDEKPNPKMSISRYFETMFIPKKEPFVKTGQLAAVTFATYKNYWRMFLSKHFNGVQTFENYDQQKALQYLENLTKKDGTPYGENTVKKIRFVAIAIFEDAIKRGYIKENPWRGIKVDDVATVKATKGIAYTENEVVSILRNLDAELGDTSKPLVAARDLNIRLSQIALAIGFWAGCRPSEIEALRWENVNVDAGTIFVKESIVNGVHAARTKTGSRNDDGSRVVSYLAPLVPILREWWKRNGSPKEGLVLQKDGKPISLRHLSNEIVQPSCKKHGLRWESWYPARRGCGTHLVNIGVSVEFGAEMLGNSIEVFQNHYWDKKGKGSARAAEIDRQYRLAQGKAAEVVSANNELALLGLGDGGAQ
jgi:integrase